MRSRRDDGQRRVVEASHIARECFAGREVDAVLYRPEHGTPRRRRHGPPPAGAASHRVRGRRREPRRPSRPHARGRTQRRASRRRNARRARTAAAGARCGAVAAGRRPRRPRHGFRASPGCYPGPRGRRRTSASSGPVAAGRRAKPGCHPESPPRGRPLGGPTPRSSRKATGGRRWRRAYPGRERPAQPAVLSSSRCPAVSGRSRCTPPREPRRRGARGSDARGGAARRGPGGTAAPWRSQARRSRRSRRRHA